MTAPPDLPQLVDVRQHGGVASLAVIAERDGRLVAITGEGGEVVVHPARVLCWTGVAPAVGDAATVAASVREFEADRGRAAGDVDTERLWSAVVDELGETSLAALTGRHREGADGRTQSALLRALVGDDLRFQVRASDVRVLGRDEVERRLRQREEEAAAREIRRGMVAWIRGEVDGPPEGGDWGVEALRQLAAQTGQVATRDPGVALLRDAGREATPAGAFQLLVERGLFEPDENLALIRAGLGRPFSPAAHDEAAEAERSLDAALADPDRRDLRDLTIVTVDDEGTREIDDGLSLERLVDGGLRVGIHLAEPGALFPADGPLAAEAAARQTTLYLPEGTHRMLPPALGQGAASLVAGADRPALSLLVELDPDGTERDARLVRSVVRVERAVPYAQADREIEAGGDLAELWRLARASRRRRIAAGALETALSEVSPRRDEGGPVEIRRSDPATAARKMVAEWMIRANRTAARVGAGAGLALPFRSQALKEPLPPDLDPVNPYQVFLATRCLGQTRTDVAPSRHHGLALDGYTQITSPLRRQLDLLAQRQLTALLRGDEPPLDEVGMRAAIAAAEPILARARAVSAASREYWQLRWLEGRVGQPQRALVLLVRRRRSRVALLDVGLRAWWRHDQPPEPGERLDLRIEAANARAGELRLARAAPPR